METQDIKTNLLETINSNNTSENGSGYTIDHFKRIIEEEFPIDEVIQKLSRVKEDRIKVRELVIESEIDFIKSVKQLQSVYDSEFKNMVQKLNERFNSEILNLQQLVRKTIVGEALVNLVNEIAEYGWVLVMKKNSVNLYKCYNPSQAVMEGMYENGESHLYDEPVCYLRGIYLNILHPKITTGTIHLSTEGQQHPNCDVKAEELKDKIDKLQGQIADKSLTLISEVNQPS
jgi:hypothetical protein